VELGLFKKRTLQAKTSQLYAAIRKSEPVKAFCYSLNFCWKCQGYPTVSDRFEMNNHFSTDYNKIDGRKFSEIAGGWNFPRVIIFRTMYLGSHAVV
jgi:hypothetical protein